MKINFLVLMAALSLLVACGGSSDSGFGESLAQERNATDCVDFGDGTVLNSCDFSIVVVTFGGTATPVTVLANGSAIDPDPTNIAFVGACRAPFTPVEVNSTEFECL